MDATPQYGVGTLLIVAVGVALIVAGLAMVSVPIAFIAAGTAIAIAAIGWERGR